MRVSRPIAAAIARLLRLRANRFCLLCLKEALLFGVSLGLGSRASYFFASNVALPSS